MTNKLNFLKAFLMLFVASVFFVSCEEDVPGGGGGTTLSDPDVTLTSPSALTLAQGEEFVISVSATANGADLNSLTINQDGARVDVSRLKYDGVEASANPKLLFDAERKSLNTDITITAHTSVETSTYTVVITDADGNTSSVSVDVTTEGDPPSIEIIGSGAISVNPGAAAGLNLKVLKGSSDLDKLAVYEDDVLIDASRISFDNNTPTENPFSIDERLAPGFEGSIYINASTESGSKTIRVVIIDDAGLEDSAEYVIVSGEAVDELDDYVVLWNASGLKGGGLDLDAAAVEAATVSKDSGDAEIIDLGINIDLPAASNWIQKIAPANGAEMRYIKPGQNGVGEGVTFADIRYKSQLEVLFNAGVALQNGQSDVVLAGDMFIISNNGKYYAINVIQVVPTAGDNEDFYQFDIKR